MQLGQTIVALECVANNCDCTEHPAIVTKVWSETEVNCVIFIDSHVFNPVMEQHLLHESVQATGKRFRLLT